MLKLRLKKVSISNNENPFIMGDCLDNLCSIELYQSSKKTHGNTSLKQDAIS